MQHLLDRLAARVRGVITRGRVVTAAINATRTLVQLSGLSGETKTKIPLFLPFGMSAFPTGGEDLILLQVGGSRSHLVALLADSAALRITDLKPGEFGFRNSKGFQVVFRQGHVEITAPQVTVNGNLTVTGNVSAGNGATMTHTTPTGQVVTVQGGITTNLV